MLTVAEQQCDSQTGLTGTPTADAIIIVACIAAFCFVMWLLFR